MDKEQEHYTLAHKGNESAESASCVLCKNYVDGLGTPSTGDIGVDISLKTVEEPVAASSSEGGDLHVDVNQHIPLVDVFGRVD